jgi:Polyketide cyclase / dehydrase and lipid transport
MPRIRVEASADVNAKPEDVYALLADYRHGHPLVLPKEHFLDLQVEAGGQGAGTIITFRLRSGGIETPYRLKVSEPEPGRVLMESDTASTLVTTFTVRPTGGGAQSNVQIATELDVPSGLAGWIQKMLYPPGMRRIYNKELRQLGEVIVSRQATHNQ